MSGFPSHQPYLNIALAASLLTFFVTLPSQGMTMAIIYSLVASVGIFALLAVLAFVISTVMRGNSRDEEYDEGFDQTNSQESESNKEQNK